MSQAKMSGGEHTTCFYKSVVLNSSAFLAASGCRDVHGPLRGPYLISCVDSNVVASEREDPPRRRHFVGSAQRLRTSWKSFDRWDRPTCRPGHVGSGQRPGFAGSVVNGCSAAALEAIFHPMDRPSLDPVLALEVGQVVEVVFGGLQLGGRLFPEPGMSRRPGRGSRRSTRPRRWRPGARPPARAVRSMSATSGSAKTRRFLCRFFHQGSGK